MTVIRDKYIIEVDNGSQAFQGLGQVVSTVEARLKALQTRTSSFMDSLDAKNVKQTTLDAASKAVKDLEEHVKAIGNNKVELGTGKAVIQLKTLEQQMARVRDSFKALSKEQAASIPSNKLIQTLTTNLSVNGKLSQGNQALIAGAGGMSEEAIRNLVAQSIYKQGVGPQMSIANGAFNSLRNKAAANVGGQANLAQMENQAEKAALARQAADDKAAASSVKLTSAVEARIQAEKALLRVGAPNRLNEESYAKASAELQRQLTGVNTNLAQREKIARGVINTLKELEKQESKTGIAQKQASSDAQLKLKTAAASQISGGITKGLYSSTEGSQILNRTMSGITKGEIRDVNELQVAINRVNAELKQSGVLRSEQQRVAVLAKVEEKNSANEIRSFLSNELRARGELNRLRGQTLHVLEQTTQEIIKSKIALKGNEEAIRAILTLNVQAAKTRSTAGGGQLNDFGVAFAAGFASQTIMAGLTNVVNRMSDFEDAMTRVRRTANGSKEVIKTLGDSILDLGTKIPVSVREMADAAAALGQVGALDFKGLTSATKQTAQIQEAAKAVRLIAETALVSEVSGEQAAIAYGQFKEVFSKDITGYKTSLKAFGIEAADTADAMKVLFGVINETANATAATTQDILDFTRQFGGVASSIGISAENVVALAGSMRNLQVSADVAGTAMVRFFSRATTDSQAFANVLGVSAAQFRASFSTDPLKAIISVFEVLRERSKTSKLAVQDFFNSIGGVETRERNAFTKVIDNIDLVKEGLSRSTDLLTNYNSVQKEASTRSETFSAAVQKLSNSFTLLVQQGAPLYETLTSLINRMADLTASIAGNQSTGMVVVFGAASAALAGMLLLVIKIGAQWKLAVTSLKTMTQEMEKQTFLLSQMAKTQAPTTAAPNGGTGKAAVAAIVGVVAGEAVMAGVSAAGGDAAVSWIGGFGRVIVDLVGASLAYTLIPKAFTALGPVFTKIGATLGADLITGIGSIASVGAVTAVATIGSVAAASVYLYSKIVGTEVEKRANAIKAVDDAVKASNQAVSESAKGQMSSLASVNDASVKSSQYSMNLASSWNEFSEALDRASKSSDKVPDTLKDLAEKMSHLKAGAADAGSVFESFGNRLKEQVEALAPAVAKATSDFQKAVTDAGAALADISSKSGVAIVAGKTEEDSAKTLRDELQKQRRRLQLAAQTADPMDVTKRVKNPSTGEIETTLGPSPAAMAIEQAKDISSQIKVLDTLIEKLKESRAAADSSKQASAAANTKMLSDGVSAVEQYLKVFGGASDANLAFIASLKDKGETTLSQASAKIGESLLKNLQEAQTRIASSTASMAAQIRSSAAEYYAKVLSGTSEEYSKAVKEQVSKIQEGAASVIDKANDWLKASLDFQEQALAVSNRSTRDELARTQEQLKKLADDRKILEDIISSTKSLDSIITGASTGVRANLANSLKAANDQMDTLAKSTLDLQRAYSMLGTSSDKEMNRVTEAIKRAAKATEASIRQGQLNVGLQVGAQQQSDSKRSKDASDFVSRRMDARTLTGDIAGTLANSKGREAEAGAAIGQAIEKFKQESVRTGRDQEKGYSEFLDQLNSELTNRFGVNSGTDVASVIKSVGSETNALLKILVERSKGDYSGALDFSRPGSREGARDSLLTQEMQANRTARRLEEALNASSSNLRAGRTRVSDIREADSFFFQQAYRSSTAFQKQQVGAPLSSEDVTSLTKNLRDAASNMSKGAADALLKFLSSPETQSVSREQFGNTVSGIASRGGNDPLSGVNKAFSDKLAQEGAFVNGMDKLLNNLAGLDLGSKYQELSVKVNQLSAAFNKAAGNAKEIK